MSTRATKRIKRDSGELPTSFDLLALYKSDFGDRILSFASGVDLCTLDIINKQFKSLTTNQWNIVTKERFGMNNGKEGWKMGTSFLRPPKFVHNAGGYEGADGGSPHVAANENIIAYTSDFKVNANASIELRDASTLNTINLRPSPISNWKVAICGREGAEIIVTSNGRKICAQRRDNEVSYNVQQLDFDTNTGCGIETIGCETHLIVAHDGRVQLYEVINEQLEQVGHGGDTNNNTELISLRKDIQVEGGVVDYDDEEELMEEKLAWSPDKTHFIVGYPHQICVWKFEAETNEITLTKTIDTAWEVNNVALAEDYIVASSKNKRVHIWNRNTGDKMVYTSMYMTKHSLCDVGITEQLWNASHWPLQLSCHGRILVSTSHIGCALCIWDMKAGKLLKRHNEAKEQGVVQMLPRGIFSEVTDMAYLQQLNAILCMTAEYENMWVFPTNQRQLDMATSIHQRVEWGLESENESGESIDDDGWDHDYFNNVHCNQCSACEVLVHEICTSEAPKCTHER